MTQQQEMEMNAKESDRSNVAEDVIVLGTASAETHGQPGVTEITGDLPMLGISDD